MPEPVSEELRELRRAERALRRAEEASREALLAAAEQLEAAGARDTYAKLAEVLGCSRQAARERVLRARGDWRDPSAG